MRALSRAVVALAPVSLVLLFAAPAFAGEWLAKDGSHIEVYGSVDGPEWEAFVDNQNCIPTGPVDDAVYRLFCTDDAMKGEDMTAAAPRGIMFRGKFYASKPLPIDLGDGITLSIVPDEVAETVTVSVLVRGKIQESVTLGNAGVTPDAVKQYKFCVTSSRCWSPVPVEASWPTNQFQWVALVQGRRPSTCSAPPWAPARQ